MTNLDVIEAEGLDRDVWNQTTVLLLVIPPLCVTFLAFFRFFSKEGGLQGRKSFKKKNFLEKNAFLLIKTAFFSIFSPFFQREGDYENKFFSRKLAFFQRGGLQRGGLRG